MNKLTQLCFLLVSFTLIKNINVVAVISNTYPQPSRPSNSSILLKYKQECGKLNQSETIDKYCTPVLEKKHALEQEQSQNWLLCTVYFEVAIQLCEKRLNVSIVENTNKNVCQSLVQLYSDYNSTNEYVKFFQNNLKNNTHCNIICSNHTNICIFLMNASQALKNASTVINQQSLDSAKHVNAKQLASVAKNENSKLPNNVEEIPRIQSNENLNDNVDPHLLNPSKNNKDQPAFEIKNTKDVDTAIESNNPPSDKRHDQNEPQQKSNISPDEETISKVNSDVANKADVSKISKVEEPNLDLNKESMDINEQLINNDKLDINGDTQLDQPEPVHSDLDQQDAVEDPNEIDNEDESEHDMQLDQNTDFQKTEKQKLNNLENRHEDHLSSMKMNDSTQFVESEDSHLFVYLLCVMAVCVLSYIIYHNKNKLLAIILEGRRGSGSRGGRRRHTASYRKLDCNIEEAITSTGRSNFNQVIY